MASSILLASLLLTTLTIVASAGNFYQDFDVTWGDGRGKILNIAQLLTLSLDKTSGSGFQSKKEYLFGKIDIQLKLVPGNSAGTVTAYYDQHMTKLISSSWEMSVEFHTFFTQMYSAKGNREQQFYLWFDPTADFHTCSILWNPLCIIFSVDGTPIREFKNSESLGVPFPNNQPTRIYSSLWNADDWATRGGLVESDWTRGLFTASYRNFNTYATKNNVLFTEQLDSTMKNYMIYNYCADTKRF